MNRLNVTRTDKDDTHVSNKLNKKRKHKVFINSLKKKQKLSTGDVLTSNEPLLKDYRDYTPHRSNMRRSRSKQTPDDPFSNMDHWRNESIYTNPANVHIWSANAHSDYKLNQTHTNSGYYTQQYNQDIQHGGQNNGNAAANSYSNRRGTRPKNSKSNKSSRMVINPFALNLKETQGGNESSSDDEQPLHHISRNRNSKLRRKENEKLVREGLEKYNQTHNLTWVSENYKKNTETVVSNSQNNFQKAFPHFTSWGSSWQDENVEYDRLFLLLRHEFLLETLRTYLYFLQEDGAKVLNFTELADETERNFVYFLNGNENQNVKSRLSGESQDLYQEILDLLEAKKDIYHILSGWTTDDKQNKTVVYTKVPVNPRNQQPRGHAALPTARTGRRPQPARNNLTGIEFVGGNSNKEAEIPNTDDTREALISEEVSSTNTFKANDPNNTLNENRRGLGKPMNKLLDGLNTPVECSRAERMMHLMGWSGGALGAKGNGITEPIKPNLSMVKGRGLGHEEVSQSNKNVHTRTPELKSRPNTPHRSLSRATRASSSLTRDRQTDTTNVSSQIVDEKKKKKEEKLKRRQESRAKHAELRRKRREERVLKKLAELAKEKEGNENCASGMGNNDISNSKEDKKAKKERSKAYYKDCKEKEKEFKTRAMELILEFLEDNSREEMVCDASLHDGERKCLHMLVESIKSRKENDKKDDVQQKNLRTQILGHKDAEELFAESQNVDGKRQLHLYKSLLSRTRTVQREDILLIKNGRYDASNTVQVRIKILKILADFLDNDNIQIIKFSSEFKKGAPAIIRAVLKDLINALRTTKSFKRTHNIPCTPEEIDILNYIYNHPKMQLNFSSLDVGAGFKCIGSIHKMKRANDGNVTKDMLENVSSDDSNEIIQNIRQKMMNKTTKAQLTEPTEANLFIIDKFDSDNDIIPLKIDGDSDNDCVCTTKDPELIDIAGDSDSYSENTFSHIQTTYSNNSSDVEICEEIVNPIVISSSSESDSNNVSAEKSKFQSTEKYLDMSDSELKFSFKAKGDLNLSESDSDESKDKVSELKSNDCVILSDTESNAMESILEALVEANIIEGDFNCEFEQNKEVNALDSDDQNAQKIEKIPKTNLQHENFLSSENEIEEIRHNKNVQHVSNKNDSESEDNLIIDETVNSDFDKSIDVTGNSDLKSDEINELSLSHNEFDECTDNVLNTLLNSDKINSIQAILDSEFEENAKSDFNDDTLISDLESEMAANTNILSVESEMKSAVDNDSNFKSTSESHDRSKEVTDSEIKPQYECSKTILTADTIIGDNKTVLTELKSDPRDNGESDPCEVTSTQIDKSFEFKSNLKASNEETISSDIVVADLNDSLLKSVISD